MQPIKSLLTKTNSHNIVLFNTILWVCSFLILLFLFSGSSSPSKIDYIYTSCFVFTLIIPVCVNLYWLIPNFLKKEKYLSFLSFFILNLILFTELNTWLFNFLLDTFFSGYFFISYHNKLEVYFIFFIFFVLTTLIKLAEDWVYLNQLENKTLKVQNQQIENQLKYLKGQINPHFLFNSLNVLYSLAIEEKKEVTNAILQLSDILRYIIYDVDFGKISIYKEIELIKNYIEFEKNRHVSDSKINFDYDVCEDVEIYPMLLLPLLENSFKHGLKSGVKNPFIDINLNVENKVLTCEMINNFISSKIEKQEKYKGVGIQNIQKNLEIIYPDKHTFSIEKTNNIYKVKLKIQL